MHPLHNLFPNAEPMPVSWGRKIEAIGILLGQTAVLSGGALRDHFLGRPVKDLDVFLPYSAGSVERLQKFLEEQGWTRIQNIPPSCEGLGEVVTVLGYSRPNQLDLNIIFLDPSVDMTPLGIASRNDFGICQIAAWVDAGCVRYDYTEAFTDDVVNLTFTLTRTGDEDRSLRRYERLQAKYPGHRLITPHLS